MFGVISIVYYVLLTMVSSNILNDSITATGLMIVFYLGITGVACVIYFRKALFNDLRTFVLAGLGPALGAIIMGYIFVKSVIDLNNPENSYSGKSLLGMQPPLAIAVLGLILGRRAHAPPVELEPRRSSGASARRPTRRCGCERPDRPRLRRLAVGERRARGDDQRVAAAPRREGRRRLRVPRQPARRHPGGVDRRQPAEDRAEHEVARAVSALEAAGIEVEAHVVSGRPAEAILLVAERQDASMIAVGTVGEGAITGALLGSVVLKLVQRSTLPLLVVPAKK